MQSLTLTHSNAHVSDCSTEAVNPSCAGLVLPGNIQFVGFLKAIGVFHPDWICHMALNSQLKLLS